MACILTRHVTIENVWYALDQSVLQRVPVHANIQQHRTAIKEEWDNIPQAIINSLVNSMRRSTSHQILTVFFIHTPMFFFKGICD